MISLGLDDWRREQRSITLSDFPGLREYLEPYRSAGVYVNEGVARTVSAYWCGVTVISQSIGVLDRFLYKRVGDDDRERATTHPVYKLIHDQPNPHMSPQVFWETLTAHALLCGNGYAEIEWDNSNRPVALWPIMPEYLVPRVEVYKTNAGSVYSDLWYQYRGQERVEAEDLIHVPGLGYDGISGYSPVALARRSLGLSVAAEEFGSSFFANGAWTGAVLEHPAKVSPEAHERLKSALDQDRGPTKAHRIKILEEGMKLSRPIVIPPDDAQFLETRQFQIEEIARWLNLPPHKLKHKMGERPGGNLEASQIDYLTDTLLPWTTRIEQELNRKLISKEQRSTFYIEHLFQKILRADVTTRMATYKSLYDMKVISPEWIAKTENLPPPPEPEPEPEPALALPAPVEPEVRPEPAQDDQRMSSSIRAVVLEALGRYVRRECARVRKSTPAAAFEFYRGEEPLLTTWLQPAVALHMAWRGLDGAVEPRARALAKEYLGLSMAYLRGAKPSEVELILERWESERPAQMADRIAAYVAGEEGHAA